MSSPLWNKKMHCLFCDRAFETTRLRASAVRIKEKQSDFGCVYEGHSPYYYAITACPHCTLAARNEEFEKFKPAYEPKLMELSRKLLRSSTKPDIFSTGELSAETAVRRHELAIAMHKYRARSEAGELAGLWMHVGWIWRMNNQAKKERAALAQAVQAYQELYEKGNQLPDRLGEPGVLYLIGELHRRMGEFQKARSYFSRALMKKELSAFPNVETLLREGMLLAKQQQQEEE